MPLCTQTGISAVIAPQTVALSVIHAGCLLVIPAVCPTSSFPQSFGRESSFLLYDLPEVRQSIVRQFIPSVSGKALWIPENYLGDDERWCRHSVVYPPCSFPRSVSHRHSRSLFGGNPVFLLYDLPEFRSQKGGAADGKTALIFRSLFRLDGLCPYVQESRPSSSAGSRLAWQWLIVFPASPPTRQGP